VVLEHVCQNGVTSGGNFAVVGHIDGTVTIWDYDVIGLVEPSFKIGNNKKPLAGQTCVHTGAVLSLAWNTELRHILATGGLDEQVLLWDLNSMKFDSAIKVIDGPVQSMQWSPLCSSQLLAGTMHGSVSLVDCRSRDHEIVGKWNFGKAADVNGILWDHFNEHRAYVVCEDGFIRSIDTRMSDQVLYGVLGHDGPVNGFALNHMVKDLFATCGGDGTLKIWKNGSDECTLVHSETLDLGNLLTVKFCPDIPTMVVVGGSANDLMRTVDISKFTKVQEVFA